MRYEVQWSYSLMDNESTKWHTLGEYSLRDRAEQVAVGFSQNPPAGLMRLRIVDVRTDIGCAARGSTVEVGS